MARSTPDGQPRPHVVIIGAGFGGLEVAHRLAGAPVDITLLDRNNYHGFWPLLYQVATAGLEPQQIAQPIRGLLRRAPNIRFHLANVESINREQRVVTTDRGTFSYDDLIVAPGSTTNFFGLNQVEQHSYELKDVPDALGIRNHIIACFEQAVTEQDAQRLKSLLTFVVVGGGPTGVELAGSIAELINHVMRKDYPGLDFSHVRVMLVEMADRVLLAFPASLSRRAQRKLEDLGVELRLNTSVVGYKNESLQLKDGTSLPTNTVIWTAGVRGADLGDKLGVELQRGARVAVTRTLQLPDDPNVWVIGDLASLDGPDGKPYPQLATVAMQQGRLVARNLLRKYRGQSLQPFHYINKGTMATVGRRFAVARVWNLNWSGPIAWLLWLGVHLYYLIGFRNRVVVLVNWAYNYFTYDRGSRALVVAATGPTATPNSDAVVKEQQDRGELAAAERG